MVLSVGHKLGPYEILGPIGAGGMGEVYRAHDTRLGREVALKILPADVAGDPSRRQRFETEARAVAALNHPNIVAIYDVAFEDRVAFIVAELIQGETLRGVIQGGPVPMRRTLDIAVQIADGLAAAHAAGIVHRDLKPDNIMLTPEGRVKILDFGLAKSIPRAAVAPDATLTIASTEPGTIVGTASYMSPEQASGKSDLDGRSDQFSLGLIIQELVTGKRAFERPTAVETMTAIIREDPAPLPATLPAPWRWCIERCLAKDPGDRYGSTRDLFLELRQLRDHSSEISAATGASGSARASAGRSLPKTGIAILIAAFACVAAGHYLWKSPSVPAPTFQSLTFEQGYVWSARFAPDGQSVIYGAAWRGNPPQLYSVRLGGVGSRSLGLPSADVLSISSSGEMAISTDRHFARGWITSGQLARLAVDGQVPRQVMTDVLWLDRSPDGRSLAVVRSVGGRYRLEYPVGTVLYETSGWISYAPVSPDGQRVAFLDHPLLGDDRGTVTVVDRSGKKSTLTREAAAAEGLAWSPGGEEIWFSATEPDVLTLHAVSLSGVVRVVSGSPDMKLQDISKDGSVLVTVEPRRMGLNGSAPGNAEEHDWSWLDYSSATNISPDGHEFLFSEAGRAGGPLYSTFIRKMDGSPPVLLGEGLGEAISPDGKWILTLIPTSPRQLSILPKGAGESKMLSRDPIEYQQAWWFPDGKRILVAGTENGHSTRLYVRDLEGGKLQPVTPEGMEVIVGQQILSPDGKWIAVSQAGQKAALYPVDGGDARAISGIGEHQMPIQWTADGRSLYVRSLDEMPARVFRLDIATGRSELWKQVMPPDRTGVVQIRAILPTPDGRAYAYSYMRILSELWVAKGLR